MEKKAQTLTVNKLIIIILVILVVVIVLLAIFNDDIWAWFKNLPGYQDDNDSDIVVDGVDSIKFGVCPTADGSLIGQFGLDSSIGSQSYFAYYTGVGTPLGTNIFLTLPENGQLSLHEGGANWFKDIINWDTKLGITNASRVIFINKEFFDLNAQYYQNIRFDKDFEAKNKSYMAFVNILQKLNGSKLVGNLVCKQGADAPLIEMWPGTNPGKIKFYPSLTWKTPLLSSNHMAIDLYPYVLEGGYEYFYLVKQSNYLEIRGSNWGIDMHDLGMIYPDGSIWFDESRMKANRPGFASSSSGAILKGGYKTQFNKYHPPFAYETNIYVDYKDIINSIDSEKGNSINSKKGNFYYDSDGRCITVDKLGDNYGLLNGKLLHLESGSWIDIEDKIPSESKIALRSVKDSLYEKVSSINVEYPDKKNLKLDSSHGVYFSTDAGSYIYYFDSNLKSFIVKEYYSLGYHDDFSNSGAVPIRVEGYYGKIVSQPSKDIFTNAFSSSGLALDSATPDLSNPYYIFSVSYGFGDSYALDGYNDFYFKTAGTNNWIKYEKNSENDYLYMVLAEWEDLENLMDTKQSLIDNCKK